MPSLFRFAASAIFVAAFTFAASAATFNVNTTNDTLDAIPGNGICADTANRCSVRAAITESNLVAGRDTINIPSGTYFQTIVAANENNNLGGDWDVSDSVTIVGSGTNFPVLRGILNGGGFPIERVMEILNQNLEVSAQNVTFFGGRATGSNTLSQGGAIRNLGDLTLTNVLIQDSLAGTGGGIYSEGSLIVTSSVVSGNDCTMTTNDCGGGGISAFLRAGEAVQLTNSVVQYNCANSGQSIPGSGGGMFVGGAGAFSVNISGGSFHHNEGGGSNSRGAGMLVLAAFGPATVNLSNNVQFYEQTFTTAGSNMRGVGIALETGGPGSITGTWDRVKLHRNSLNHNATTSGVSGGNLAAHSFGQSIFLTIRNSIFYGGRAFKGGAIAMENGPTASTSVRIDVTNSSFVKNTVDNPNNANDGDGGAFYIKRGSGVSTAARLTTNFCTISQNVALRGPAVFNEPASAGRVIIGNSVVDFHAGSGDIAGPAFSGAYCHFDETPGTNVTLTMSDTFGYAGLVYAPGGEYLVPLTTSPVINMIPNGTNGCGASGGGITIDQLFQTRPFNGACDKGAIELQEFPQG